MLVQALVRRQAYEHAIELLRTAIREGKGEPWMYEALAMVLRMAGRPEEEVVEVLLSAADVISDSPLSLYRVADQLAKFGHEQEALNLLRRASALAPSVPDPYERALPLALSLEDVDAMAWAASNLVRRAWPDRHFELHRQAYAAVEELCQKLRQKGLHQDAERLRQRIRQADQRDLVIRVSWQGNGDVDIRVLEPIGTECSIRNRRTAAGGVLVQDGMGKNPVEIYMCPRAFPGTYQVFCRKVWGTVLGDRVRVEVIRWEGTDEEEREVHYVTLGQREPVLVELPRGRRHELAEVTDVRVEYEGETWKSTVIMPLAKLQRFLQSSRRPNGSRARHLYQVAFGGAVAYQPIPFPILDGASLGLRAVISADRRYVRISIAPFFANVVGFDRFPIFATFR